jgi:hypothetical protein
MGMGSVHHLKWLSCRIDTIYRFDKFVTDKGFVSFAAQKCRRTLGRLEAAKVMKPCGELNVGARLDL